MLPVIILVSFAGGLIRLGGAESTQIRDMIQLGLGQTWTVIFGPAVRLHGPWIFLWF